MSTIRSSVLFMLPAIFAYGLNFILLYETDNDEYGEHKDCIYYNAKDGSINKYCLRYINSYKQEISYTNCTSNGEYWSFENLIADYILPSTVLTWSSSVEMADHYAYFFYNRSAILDKNYFLCKCNRQGSFGRYCEYELLFEAASVPEAFSVQFEQKLDYEENQRWAKLVCYDTLACNFGILCLDWRNICDFEQQCIDGLDEENCDKIEFNECDKDEYRCGNGMCIDDIYFLDGDPDCMDFSDEAFIDRPHCYAHPHTFHCDEYKRGMGYWSCGDGDYITYHARVPFQTFDSDAVLCANLREMSHMCEIWHDMAAWTMPNGMCEVKPGYDDPRYNTTILAIKSTETCRYLLRCALTDGFEQDCPCGKTISCKQHMLSLCPNPEMIPFTNLALIAPYIFLYYAVQDEYSDKIPKNITASGSIKCRGYLGNIANTEELSFIYDLDFIHAMKDHIFCKAPFIKKNTSSVTSFYPLNCWNDSYTFSKQMYYSTEVCWESTLCISPYRINDGVFDCPLIEDEMENTSISTCTKIQRYRFQCSSEQPLCLLPPVLGTKQRYCDNGFDQYVYGNGTILSDIKCGHRNDDGCRFYKNYIEQSSKNKTIGYEDLYLTERIPHHVYCNSHWNMNPPIDEDSLFCKEWVCPTGFFRCRSNQCIPAAWICDGEWDCKDASDEQGIFIYENVSIVNQHIDNLEQRIEQCKKHYTTQPFSDICNISIQFPCLLANVTNPTDIKSYPPCINLTLVGDGIYHCYGGLDERNTEMSCAFMRARGFDFRCIHSSECIPDALLCNVRCENEADDYPLCFYKTNNESCNGRSDVLCLGGQCIHNARCNKIYECPHGEDEYWCSYVQGFTPYRFDKYQSDKNQPRQIDWMSFPVKVESTLASFRSVYDTINDSIWSITEQDDKSGAFICNRGLAIKEGKQIRCLCSGSNYGKNCEYFSDRVTIITHLNLSYTEYDQIAEKDIVIKVVVSLLFKEEKVIDSYQFHVVPELEKQYYRKHKFHLVYSRSEQLLKHKKDRYFNRTDIINNHPYSVRFESYELQPNKARVLAAWNYPIYFDYLPSFRLATSLKFPQTYTSRNDHFQCINITCNSNSICIPFFTNQQWSYLCFCKSGFYGHNCQLFDQTCMTYCPAESICKPNAQSQLLENGVAVCICPHNRFGRRCNLKFDDCDSSPCQNNGTCHQTYDPSGLQPFVCLCHMFFHGDLCQHEKSSVSIQLKESSLPSTIITSVVQYYDVDNITFNLILRRQQLFNGIPSYINIYHTLIEAPVLGVLKAYASVTSTRYYILYIQPHLFNINITSAPQHCPHVSSLFPRSDHVPLIFKYHRVCQNHSFQLCFYDSVYFCICQGTQIQVNCFNHDPFLDQCDYCLSAGKCIRGDRQDPDDFSCLCPYCYTGRLCEFSMQPFTLTLDSLLAFDNITVQIFYLVMVSITVIVGFLNNFLSFVTFQRPEARKISIGNWLLVVTIFNQCSLFGLFIKFLHILIGSSTGWKNDVSCKAINYILATSTRVSFWFTTWITIDRLLMIIFPTALIIKSSGFAFWVAIITIVTLLTMHVHELLFSVSIHQPNSIISLCVITFRDQNALAAYSRLNTLLQYMVPFSLQTVSIILLITLLARKRMKTKARQIKFHQILRKELKAQKETFLIPSITVLSALPQTVLSFSLVCNPLVAWQRHALLVAYLFSYIPQTFSAVLYVMPSTVYKKEFFKSSVGKTIDRWFH